MNLLYINYWGINDGLTSATVFPYLYELEKSDVISNIYFISIERGEYNLPVFIKESVKINHMPVNSVGLGASIINKIIDIYSIKKQILKIVKQINIDKVFCKGAVAGSFGYMINKKFRIPFYVDSYEPHADYMMASNTWSKYGLKYLFQKRWEKKQMQFASKLFPVSYKYFNLLKELGVAENKMHVVPVCVDEKKFKYNDKEANKIKKRFNIKEKIVGIYIGKFGGMYYNAEIFDFFKEIKKYFSDNLFLFVLTSDDDINILNKLIHIGIKEENLYVGKVNHEFINNYLSASDFAISMMKSTDYSEYCSPTKHGEYWAVGLPVISTKNISDDSDIIEQENIGYILKELNEKEYKNAIKKIDNLLKQDNEVLRNKIRKIAIKYRSFTIAEEIYNEIYGNNK